jgi:hypothetical protein
VLEHIDKMPRVARPTGGNQRDVTHRPHRFELLVSPAPKR